MQPRFSTAAKRKDTVSHLPHELTTVHSTLFIFTVSNCQQQYNEHHYVNITMEYTKCNFAFIRLCVTTIIHSVISCCWLGHRKGIPKSELFGEAGLMPRNSGKIGQLNKNRK